MARDVRCRYPECQVVDGLECAHLDGHKRAHTRGQPPETRHDEAHLMMLCRRHHTGYDGGGHGKEFTVEYLTERCAGGPCRFRSFGTQTVIGES